MNFSFHFKGRTRVLSTRQEVTAECPAKHLLCQQTFPKPSFKDIFSIFHLPFTKIEQQCLGMSSWLALLQECIQAEICVTFFSVIYFLCVVITPVKLDPVAGIIWSCTGGNWVRAWLWEHSHTARWSQLPCPNKGLWVRCRSAGDSHRVIKALLLGYCLPDPSQTASRCSSLSPLEAKVWREQDSCFLSFSFFL